MLTGMDFQTKFALQMLLEQERDLYVESIHDEMDNEWQTLINNVDCEDFHPAFLEMKSGWDERMRDFEIDFFLSHLHEKNSKLKRRLRRGKRQNQQLQAQLEQKELELYRAKGDLAIERGLTDHLRDSIRCRNCNGEL